jgi:hypothetical protein
MKNPRTVFVGAGLVPARFYTKDTGRDEPCPYKYFDGDAFK